MPNRYIRDSRTSKRLAQLSDFAERGFWRLVQAADDYGRFEADPPVLLAHCFPRPPAGVTLARIEAMLTEYVSLSLVHVYDIGGERFGEFLNDAARLFTKRAKFSKYPAPPAPPIPHASASICVQMRPNIEDRISKIDLHGAARRPLARVPGRSDIDFLATLERLRSKFGGQDGP